MILKTFVQRIGMASIAKSGFTIHQQSLNHRTRQVLTFRTGLMNYTVQRFLSGLFVNYYHYPNIKVIVIYLYIYFNYQNRSPL